MSTRESRKTSSKLLKQEKACPFVVAESEIRDYVENLGINDVETIATWFQIVADLTKNAAADHLDPSTLRHIKRLAAEDSNKQYRRIMEAIIVSIGKGERGINAAHLSANVAVQIIFRWSAEYFSALDDYRNELRKRKLRLLDQGPARRSSRRPVLRVADDQ